MIRLDIDKKVLLNAADKNARLVLKGILDGVKEQTRGLEQDLEHVTQEAVPGRLFKGWQSQTIKKIARTPAGWVYFSHGDRSQGAIAFWTKEGRISRGGGKYLAFPTPAAGKRGYGTGRNYRINSPKAWEAAHGVKLRFRPAKKGDNAVLILEKAAVSSKTGRATPAGKRTKEPVGVVMFILIPFVDHANTVAIEPVIEKRRASFSSTIERNIDAALRRDQT
jgi:hypothetical protein